MLKGSEREQNMEHSQPFQQQSPPSLSPGRPEQIVVRLVAGQRRELLLGLQIARDRLVHRRGSSTTARSRLEPAPAVVAAGGGR